MRCYSPLDALQSEQLNLTGEWLGMDRQEFQSEIFQRPYQYLLRYENEQDLDQFSYSEPEGQLLICFTVCSPKCLYQVHEPI